jgi:hypothetical protein
MEVLGRLFMTAQQDGLIRGLQQFGIKHQCSLYADDVILLARPDIDEAQAIKEILRIFGDASGLRTNLAKCSITEIYGAGEAMEEVRQVLGCQMVEFPIRYLGLPLSTSKVPRAEVRKVVEAVSRRLPSCHGPLMAESGRLIWIKSVLSSVPIYCMIADGLATVGTERN